MRTVLFAIILSSAAAAWAGDSRNTTQPPDERTLTADEVGKYAVPYYAAIRSCFFEHARSMKGATGELSITLVVNRDGYVREVAVDAPGVRGKALRRLDACIRNEVLVWHFPVRRDFTTAILPYYFLYLDIPSAGPQYSCWDPRGCRRRTKQTTVPTS